MKSLTSEQIFLNQSYIAAWQEFEYIQTDKRAIRWDWVVITASNEQQAGGYREQIKFRMENGFLPEGTKYVVIPDPDGKRVGSGGATLNVLKYIAEHTEGEPFIGKRILVIHSGGDSKRVPQYSACGKLFAPVPRELPNGSRSTLFDEFIITLAGVAPRMNDGMLVISGDIVLLFNPLQIDMNFKGAAAISIKEPVEVGKDHGVFLSRDGIGIQKFLHKQSVERLNAEGAVNEKGMVDLDTGTIWFEGALLHKFYSLLAPNGTVEQASFDKYINEKIRLSFYGDFLYPLASEATLDDYLKEDAEGEMCEELLSCRREIWELLKDEEMAIVRMAPAKYIHFGTTEELVALNNDAEAIYHYLGWNKQVLTNIPTDANYAGSNSLVENGAFVGEGSYLEDCIIGKNATIGKRCVVSGVAVDGQIIPDETVIHGLVLENGKCVTRIYGIKDNPKGTGKATFLGTSLEELVEKGLFEEGDLWEESEKERSIWTAKLYPVCDSMKESVDRAVLLKKICTGQADKKEVEAFKLCERTSLKESFNLTDNSTILSWQSDLENQIRVQKCMDAVKAGKSLEEAFKALSVDKNSLKKQIALLFEKCEEDELFLKSRVYMGAADYLKKQVEDSEKEWYRLEDECYAQVFGAVKKATLENYKPVSLGAVKKDRVKVELPVRVNWCGGPSDAPPYCMENGGAVINAAISLRGELPVCVTLEKIPNRVVEFKTVDINKEKTFTSLEQLTACADNYDFFALHKAVLLATGVLPMGETDLTLEEVLDKIGGGLRLETKVNVPMGSGLGTSSILAAACVKAVHELFGLERDDERLFAEVMCAEQLMNTGGGWQDQVGGAVNGVKLITTRPGVLQKINVEYVNLTEETKKELQERFVLVYSGQRRRAKNVLRQQMNRYILGIEEICEQMHEVQQLAVMEKYELECGNIDGFAKLLNRQWEILKNLDAGTSNLYIEHIFEICSDLIEGYSICGAGGGGFLQMILKKGVSKEILSERLKKEFQDCGVSVWDSEFIF